MSVLSLKGTNIDVDYGKENILLKWFLSLISKMLGIPRFTFNTMCISCNYTFVYLIEYSSISTIYKVEIMFVSLLRSEKLKNLSGLKAVVLIKILCFEKLKELICLRFENLFFGNGFSAFISEMLGIHSVPSFVHSSVYICQYTHFWQLIFCLLL